MNTKELNINNTEKINSILKVVISVLVVFIFTLIMTIIIMMFGYNNKVQTLEIEMSKTNVSLTDEKLKNAKFYNQILSLKTELNSLIDENKKIVDTNKDIVKENYSLQKKIKKYKKIELKKREVASYKALFTAYFPDDSEIEGGFYDAGGKLLDPENELTCAAPPEIPLGTQIKISGTGTSKDGKIYTVTDRGGAIKIMNNGTYHIDLLFSSDPICNEWGKKYGVITILKPKSKNNT